MSPEEFELIFDAQIEHCRQVMFEKGKVYTTDDFFSNFKHGGAIVGKPPLEVLHMFMLKHIVAFSNAVHERKNWTMEQWIESIGDQINYLVIARGLLEEARR